MDGITALLTPPAPHLVTHFDPTVVALSFAVASYGSFIALIIAGMLLTEERSDKRKNLLHILGSLVLGATIWSMHFIGMLAFRINILVDYEPFITFFSMLLAITSANGVFWIVRMGKLTPFRLVAGAILMGCGIAAMHYTGMSAMSMQASMAYATPYVLASIVIAILASGAALLLAFNVSHLPAAMGLPGRLMAAFLMGFAICGMHYTGMHALSIHPFADCTFIEKQSFYGLTTAVTAVTGLIFGISAYLILKPEAPKPYSPYH